MRLLLGTDHYPPFIGGAHVQTYVLAHALTRRGHEVAVAAPWARGLPGVEDEDGVAVHRLRQLRTVVGRTLPLGRQQHQPPFADPVTAVQMRRLIRSFRPEVIHSHGWISYSVRAALTGLEIPLVLSAREYGYSCPKRTLLYEGATCSGPAPRKCAGCAGDHYGRPKGWVATAGVLAERGWLSRRTDSLHSVSHFVKDVMRRDFLRSDTPEIPESVIPEAVPERGPVTPAVAADLDRLPSEPFILFVGELRNDKGVRELLAAYELLTAPPTLVMVGTRGAETPTALPPGVVMLTDFSHGAVLRAWDRCLFGVFPSLWPEPLGTVVCEAVSQGKAVIGTRPGGHEDTIQEGVSGLLVERGDVGALAGAMQRLLDDAPLRTDLAGGARASADRFAVDTVIAQFETVYEQARAGKRGGVEAGPAM